MGYLTVPFACTITGWSIEVDTGHVTVDFWLVGSGTTLPTSANSITASATPTLSSGGVIQSTTLTGWTTAIPAGSIIAANITSTDDSAPNYVTAQLVCQ
jgi:hypothetical protein